MSWISNLVKKKLMDEVGKQLNLEISADGKQIDFKSSKQCKFCKETIPIEANICPKCNLVLE